MLKWNQNRKKKSQKCLPKQNSKKKKKPIVSQNISFQYNQNILFQFWWLKKVYICKKRDLFSKSYFETKKSKTFCSENVKMVWFLFPPNEISSKATCFPKHCDENCFSIRNSFDDKFLTTSRTEINKELCFHITRRRGNPAGENSKYTEYTLGCGNYYVASV